MKKSTRAKKTKNKQTEKIISTLIIIILIIASWVINKQENNNQENQINETNITAEQAQTEKNTVSSTKYNLSNIPEYTDKIYIEINNNIPYFEGSEYTTKAFENYSQLDNLKRCGVAYANICKEIMPTEKRGRIFSTKLCLFYSFSTTLLFYRDIRSIFLPDDGAVPPGWYFPTAR